MMKQRLMTPGPAEVPPETLLELARPIFHHRTSEFREILAKVTDDLRYVLQTQADVFIFTASGTGAMEAAVVNLLGPGDKAVCVRGGKFGERWGELCERFGAEVIPIDPAWGDAPDPEAIRKALADNPDVAAVYTTLCETSTGVVSDIEAIGKIVAPTGACLVVDGISSVGAIPMNQEVFAHGGGDPDASTLPLYDSSGQSAGYIQRFTLVTMSPGDTLVTFVNRQTGAAQYFVYLPLIVKNGQSARVR